MARHLAPQRITSEDLHHASDFFNALYEDQDDELQIDCADLRFVDPLGLCLLRHHLGLLSTVGAQIHLEDLSRANAAYLDRMDFFDGLENVHCQNRPAANRRNQLGHSLVELHQIREAHDVDPAAGRIAAAVVGASGAPADPDPDGMRASPADRLHSALQYVFSELLNNSAFHGRARGYAAAEIWVAAQYYRRTGRVHLAILDNGCGFLLSLRDHSALREETHQAAIEAALRPRVSCNRDLARGLDSGNQGIGLTASHAIALASSGTVDIISGDSWLRSTSDGHTYEELARPWQGVGVSLQMSRELLQDVAIGDIIGNIAPIREVRDFQFE
jgi:anti-anti-sigma regulatory factor